MQIYSKNNKNCFFSLSSWPIFILFVLSDRARWRLQNLYTKFWNSLIMLIYANLRSPGRDPGVQSAFKKKNYIIIFFFFFHVLSRASNLYFSHSNFFIFSPFPGHQMFIFWPVENCTTWNLRYLMLRDAGWALRHWRSCWWCYPQCSVFYRVKSNILVHILVCALTVAFLDRFFWWRCIVVNCTRVLFLVMLPPVFRLL